MKKLIKQIIDRFRSQYTISRLRVKEGDFLIVKLSNGLLVDRNYDFLETLAKTLRKRNMSDTMIMCLDKDCDLQNLSEEEMNKAGWFRKKEINAEGGKEGY